jgi:hypothetical protein
LQIERREAYGDYDFAAAGECGQQREQFCLCRGDTGVFGELPDGRDTLDFTQIANMLPSDTIVQAFAESQNGNSGYYIPVQGAALNNWKLKAFVGGGTEVTAGAYPAGVTGDIVQLSITARKLL